MIDDDLGFTAHRGGVAQHIGGAEQLTWLGPNQVGGHQVVPTLRGQAWRKFEHDRITAIGGGADQPIVFALAVQRQDHIVT